MKKVVLIALLNVLLSVAARGQQAPADLILFGGKVFTGDPARPSAEAVATRGERIIAVGTSAEVKRLAGATTRVIDLGGRVVVPWRCATVDAQCPPLESASCVRT